MRNLAAALIAASIFACGDDGHDATPTIVVGGGAQDPGIDGEVNVYVIDDDTDEPLSGATVRIGDIEGTTDSDGLFVASAEGLQGKQTVVASATNYAASMWIGIDAANITIPLKRATADTTDVPHAELSGTIAGWEALPAPVANHLRVAFVTYSQTKELGDRANELKPPVMDANVCLRGPQSAAQPCNWRINARAGTIAVAAVIVDLDTKGTFTDASDDTSVVEKFAIKRPVTVVDGATQSGITLELLASAPTAANVTFGTAPAGLTNVASIVGVDLGDEGVLRFQLAAAMPNRTMVGVPPLSEFPGATYELLGIAKEPDITDGTAAESIVLQRDLSTASFVIDSWLAPPTGMAADRTMVTYTPAADASLTIVEIETAPTSGEPARAMTIASFDGTSSITLPTDIALPSGPITVRVNGFGVDDFDPQDFEVDALVDSIELLAGEALRLN